MMKKLMIYTLTFAIIVFIPMMSVFTGRVSLFLSGFAVDSFGLLYVGKNYCIEVY